jgi:hypothetical protein
MSARRHLLLVWRRTFVTVAAMARVFLRPVFSAMAIGVAVCFSAALRAQQVADTDFKPAIAKPAFAEGGGPVIAIDEAHFNFHTASGRYLPFAALLRRDGYVVRGATGAFTEQTLQGVRVLVIANALNERNARGNWSLPTPSAFTEPEIAALKAWVEGGGALFLIVDHMPFPGSNAALAQAFGFSFSNGFAWESETKRDPLVFSRANGALRDHAILRGRSAGETVDSVTTFTGSAFQCPPAAVSLLVLPRGTISLEPAVAWTFDRTTTKTDVGGWSQGAVMKFGEGRVAVFGEAGMFSAQHSGPQKSPMGMNSPRAKQNAQFLLNLVHWLSGVVD